MTRGSVAVIGGGTWGLALAAAAARTGEPTWLVSRRALNGALPPGVERVTDVREVAPRARIYVLAVPSEVARKVLSDLGDRIDGRHFVVHGIRGLAGDRLQRVSELVREETPARRIAALGGPAVAEDLLAGRPSLLVVGSSYPEVNQAVVQALGSDSLRIYSTDDLVGLEWASALVGCLALGVGFAQGLGIGPGLLAGLVSRGVTEAAKLAGAATGDPQTLFGLAGFGDLLACSGQPDRPEVRVGAALAKGERLDKAMSDVRQRVEAVQMIPRIVDWAHARGIRAPIFTALGEVLAARPAGDIVHALMTAPIEDRG